MDEIFAALEVAKQIRDQRAQQARQPQQQPQPVAAQQLISDAPALPDTPAPEAAAASAPAVAQPLQAPRRRRNPALQGMFEDGNTLLRAVVASEVLGPPRALRENALWSLQPSEP